MFLTLIILIVILADQVPPGLTVVGRRGLGEERKPERGGGRALLPGGAAAGTLPGADGLQHAAFSFLQHVLLMRREKQG